jgi:hypothetical protein
LHYLWIGKECIDLFNPRHTNSFSFPLHVNDSKATVKKILFLLIELLSIINYNARAQDSQSYPEGRMQHRADSVSNRTDSLIKLNNLLHIEIKSKYPNNTQESNRHYFIDTVHGYILKCIYDTTFIDYYGIKFKQIVVYFNEGYEFKSCWNTNPGSNSDVCSYSNIYPEEYEIMQQIGKLNVLETMEDVDKKLKWYIASELQSAKIFQKKYGY